MARRAADLRWVFALAVSVAALAICRTAVAACESNADCKGGRVCVSGECVEPPTVTTCVKDADCPGEEICQGGQCIHGDAVGAASAPTPPTQPAGGSAPTPPPPPADRPASVPPVAAAPQGGESAPAGGTIVVESTEPGAVYLDKGKVGDVQPGKPFRLPNVTPGRHRIKVESSLGGTTDEDVTVVLGQEVALRHEPSEFRLLSRFRRGVSFGVGVGGVYHYGEPIHGGGGIIEALLNVGGVPAVDFRVALDVGIESIESRWQAVGFPDLKAGCSTCTGNINYTEDWNNLAIIPSVAPSLRLNLGSVYSMAFGFRAGFAILTDVEPYEASVSCNCSGCGASRCDQDMELAGQILPHLGPEWSLLSFRMGAKREMELEFWQGIIFPIEPRDHVAYNQGLSFRYLFLGDSEPAVEP